MIAGYVEAARRDAESLMLDAGKAIRPDGSTWYDKLTQTERKGGEDLFASRCKIQTRQVQARESEVGGRTAVSVRTELHLPADTEPLEVGDLWEITAAHPLSLAVVGQQVRVIAPVAGSLKTARRYEVEQEVS